MPIIGVVQNRVPQNPKCNGCTHFNKGTSNCEIGLSPAVCGDGSTPDMGYAPVDEAGPNIVFAEVPDHATSSRPGREVPQANARVPMTVSHLGDESELLALAKSIRSDMQKACSNGCAVHQYGEQVTGQHNIYTAGAKCTCLPLSNGDVAKAMHSQLSIQARGRLRVEDVETWLSQQ